jgi:hypothetical protein
MTEIAKHWIDGEWKTSDKSAWNAKPSRLIAELSTR